MLKSFSMSNKSWIISNLFTDMTDMALKLTHADSELKWYHWSSLNDSSETSSVIYGFNDDEKKK